MNIPEFVGQAQSNYTVQDSVNYFDHTLLAYNIFKEFSSLSIHGYTDTLSSSFILEISSSNDSDMDTIKKMINNISYTQVNIYNKSFTVNSINDERYVRLAIKEV